MHLHQFISVRGCITQDKYIKGRTLSDLESILGFHKGRLSNGIVVAALLQVPSNNQFDFLGYTQVAEHRFNKNVLKGLDVNKLKDLVRQSVFTTVGTERLVKVLPNAPHSDQMDNDEQYPPGWGIPQWKLVSKLDAEVVAIVNGGGRYI